MAILLQLESDEVIPTSILRDPLIDKFNVVRANDSTVTTYTKCVNDDGTYKVQIEDHINTVDGWCERRRCQQWRVDHYKKVQPDDNLSRVLQVDTFHIYEYVWIPVSDEVFSSKYRLTDVDDSSWSTAE